ncbi:MAG TPA: RidA family protein [Clostridiales bacterium]|nr:RidA family protein [Clostridiales bacterium]
MDKEFINAKNAPAAVGPYVHARKAANMYFISGQLGLIADTGELAVGIEAQTHQSLKNLGIILKEAGLEYSDVVKTTIFLDDINDFAKVNEIYAQYFTGVTPARSCVEVGRIPKDALVEVEAIAVKDN